MTKDTYPAYRIFSDANCSGQATNIITALVDSCEAYGAPSFQMHWIVYENLLGPPKSMILYQGSLTFGYPDYDKFTIGTCHNFSPNVLSVMSDSVTGISTSEYPTDVLGKICNTGVANPNIPVFESSFDHKAQITFYEKNDCSGKNVAIGLGNGGCNQHPFQDGLNLFTNATKGTAPYQSYKLDPNSSLLMYTPSKNWVSVVSTGCNIVPKDVLADLQNNIATTNPFEFKTDSSFCPIHTLKNSTFSTTTTAAETSHPSSSVIHAPSVLLVLFLCFLFRQ
ncbi:hypothetical protein HDV01_003881 [Terramyces sp. JEL0728]|nr:hypothetical protein HDV01_003881 [Terramyces sp. JEL0728]